MKFGTILADPPWNESGAGQVKRGADRHYPLMSTAELGSLLVSAVAAPDAHLWLWTTLSHLPDGLWLMDRWGFKYVTHLVWVKGVGCRDCDGWGAVSLTVPCSTCDYTGLAPSATVQQGLGQYVRGAHELVLFGKRGQPPYRTKPDGKRAQVPSAFVARRTEHSKKPEHIHQAAEMISPGPRLEMFARRPRDGWSVFGNQVEGSVEIPTAQGRLF